MTTSEFTDNDLAIQDAAMVALIENVKRVQRDKGVPVWDMLQAEMNPADWTELEAAEIRHAERMKR